MLEAGIKLLGADFTDGLLENVDNPLAGLFAGILATVLVQSSSVTTSTLVGLVGAGVLSIDAAVPMIMGANIGTTITNTLVSLGHVRRTEEFRRAFAAATMHDFFNITTVIIFFPLELATGFLTAASEAVADLISATGVAGTESQSPLKQAVKEPVRIIKDVLGSFTDSDQVLATLLILSGMAVIFSALFFVSRNMRALIASRIERTLNAAIARGGGIVGMAAGAVITVAVQSSSITTSIVVPLVGSGVLSVRNAYPLTLGANVGTPVTALLASLAVDSRAGLVIALHHALFNIMGALLFFRLAERLANIAVRHRAVVGIYVIGLFVVVPLAGIALLR